MKKIISIFIALVIVFSSCSMISAAGQENSTVLAQSDDIPSVGAIRWDAWYGHTNKGWDVISDVEQALSPSQFHFRAPFFAEITKYNKIIIPQYTQEIFDQEMEYAKYAGIDYFAYIWYDEGDDTNPHKGMQKARKFHQTSKYRTDVKMCVIDPPSHEDALAEISSMLTSDYYMTVLDGRPLMYYIYTGDMSVITERINIFKNLAQQLGVKEPYAVIMNPSARDAKNGGASAVSKYAIAGTQLSFDELTKEAENVWNEKYTQCKSYFTQFQFVPTVTYGWHTKPRYINPVTWMTVGENYWCDYATDIELLNHLAYAMSYVQHPSVKPYCEANTVIAYAWNEHDEGGWICPTLEVDENGNQLYNKDGTKKINERRINATKLATDFIKAGNVVKVKVGNTTNNSTITSASSAIANVQDIINGIGTFKGAQLNIGSSLNIDFYVDNNAPAENISLRFTTSSGYNVTTKGVVDEKTGYLKFSYTGINPQCMADNITVDIMYNGQCIKTMNYSVKQYCENMIGKTKEELKLTDVQYNSLKVLLADILSYGKAAQLYRNYNTDNLADTPSFVAQYKSTFVVPKGIKTILGNQNANYFVKSASLNMSNVNKIYFRLALADKNITIKLNGQNVNLSRLIKQADGTYLLYTEDIYATDFDKVFMLELILGDTVITEVRYNINAYIMQKYNNASVGEIAKALSQYGISTKAYQASFAGGGDITFDDVEEFPITKDGEIIFEDREIF